jgi:hypothetical protein
MVYFLGEREKIDPINNVATIIQAIGGAGVVRSLPNMPWCFLTSLTLTERNGSPGPGSVASRRILKAGHDIVGPISSTCQPKYYGMHQIK